MSSNTSKISKFLFKNYHHSSNIPVAFHNVTFLKLLNSATTDVKLLLWFFVKIFLKSFTTAFQSWLWLFILYYIIINDF